MAKTKIGTKLLADSAITTAKLGTSAITRDKIQSGSIQVGHLDLFQSRNDIVHLEDADILIVSASKGDGGGMRTVTFAALKAAVSASNAAVGDEGHIQFHGAGGTNAMDAISKIRTDGVHLTASDGGKIAFAFTGVSGSSGEIFANAKKALTVQATQTLNFKIDDDTLIKLDTNALTPITSSTIDLGASGRLWNNIYVNNLSASNNAQLHKIDVDVADIEVVRATKISGSGTSQLHKLDTDEATFNVVKATNLTSSAIAQIHKLDSDLGTIDRVSALVVTGSGTSTIHKLDSDLGTIDRVAALVVTGSGTSLFHKLTVDQGTYGDVVTTNLSSSGLAQFHNLTANDVSGAIGEFHKLKVDLLDARTYKSTITTKEHYEIAAKQIIAAVSQSAGAAVEGAGLQIGGTAGTGSTGIASVVLGDAGGGAGKDLLFKIGATQGVSLSATGGRKNDAVLLGVSGTLSASVGVFQELDVARGLNALSFSGSQGTFHTVSGSNLTVHFVNADEAQLGSVSGSTATYNLVSGSNINVHSLDADKGRISDLSGSSAKYHTVSGSTVTVNLLDADRASINDLDVVTISGSKVATLHKVTSDHLSSSTIQAHQITADKLAVSSLNGTDIIKAEHLNREIVFDADNGNGGLSFTNGVLSIGHQRQVFSRDSSVANRIALSAGSGSLFTTASLAADAGGKPTIIMSGSEMVYLNGVLLIPAPGGQRPPVDGDYTIDYNDTNGPVTVELHETLTLDADDILVVQYLSGTISAGS